MENSNSSAVPHEDSVHYERVDGLTVNIFVDGPGETVSQPAHPDVMKMLGLNRLQVEELVARARREQE